jgi:hypothetical protein
MQDQILDRQTQLACAAKAAYHGHSQTKIIFVLPDSGHGDVANHIL